MTSDESAFIAAIKAAPDDDAPRLIYADWLDEHAGVIECDRCKHRALVFDGEKSHLMIPNDAGQFVSPAKCPTCGGSGHVSNGNAERAEFIRVQCELARLPQPESKTTKPILPGKSYHEGEGICVRCTHDSECRYHELKSRQFEIGPLITLSDARDWMECHRHHRGFVHSITCTAADWLAHGDAICEWHPVREVRLTTDIGNYIAADDYGWYFTDGTREASGAYRVIMDCNHLALDAPVISAEGDQIRETMLSLNWPGVTFHLPQQVGATVSGIAGEYLNAGDLVYIDQDGTYRRVHSGRRISGVAENNAAYGGRVGIVRHT